MTMSQFKEEVEVEKTSHSKVIDWGTPLMVREVNLPSSCTVTVSTPFSWTLRVSIFFPFTKRVEVDVFLTPTLGVEQAPMLDAVEKEANPDPKPLEAKTLVNPGIPMPPNGEKAGKKGSSILRWLRDEDVDEEPCRLELLLPDLW